MCNKQLPRRSLAELDTVIEEIIQRNPKEYQELLDLIQEGNIGLMKAVKRYDPSNGARLVSYAIHWIKAEIHEYILKNWRLVKMATTKAQRKLVFNLRSNKPSLNARTPGEVEALAKA